MISDWQGDRRIGPTTLSETLSGMLRPALTIIVCVAAVSALVVALRRMDDPLNWFVNLRLWATNFGILIAVIAVGGLFGPRRALAITIGLVGGAIALAIWFMALPILSAFGVVMIVPVR